MIKIKFLFLILFVILNLQSCIKCKYGLFNYYNFKNINSNSISLKKFINGKVDKELTIEAQDERNLLNFLTSSTGENGSITSSLSASDSIQLFESNKYIRTYINSKSKEGLNTKAIYSDSSKSLYSLENYRLIKEVKECSTTNFYTFDIII